MVSKSDGMSAATLARVIEEALGKAVSPSPPDKGPTQPSIPFSSVQPVGAPVQAHTPIPKMEQLQAIQPQMMHSPRTPAAGHMQVQALHQRNPYLPRGDMHPAMPPRPLGSENRMQIHAPASEMQGNQTMPFRPTLPPLQRHVGAQNPAHGMHPHQRIPYRPGNDQMPGTHAMPFRPNVPPLQRNDMGAENQAHSPVQNFQQRNPYRPGIDPMLGNSAMPFRPNLPPLQRDNQIQNPAQPPQIGIQRRFVNPENKNP